MFKFLKDKLKGALSSFSKKVEEVVEEKVEDAIETTTNDQSAGDAQVTSAAQETPQIERRAKETPVKEERRKQKKEKSTTNDKSAGDASATPAKQDAATLTAPATVESSSESKKEQKSKKDETTKTEQGQQTTDIPKITIPEKKESIFSKIKNVFVKKEAPVEEPKLSDVELAHKEYDEIVIEKPELNVEGAPLKTVNIHEQRVEEEMPIVEGMFEPVEPKVEKPKKENKYNPDDFHPEKVKKRIKADVEPELAPVEIKSEPDVTPPTKIVLGQQDAGHHDAKPVHVEKKGFFTKLREAVTTKKITAEQFDELFWDLEVALLENNVAMEVIEKIKQDLKVSLVDQPIPRGKIEDTILKTLKASLEGLFDVPQIDLFELAKNKKPLVICFVGINGSGKTTTIAKVTHMLKSRGNEVVLAAADTFRAAAIDQLQLHADKLCVKLIKHDYGADPAAVAFDAIKHAEATKKDFVLIDTAGRLHSNINLVDEMKKIVRVAKPDLILFIGESITGNDCVEQAKQFNDAVGINGIILSKADIDEKGGAAISVSYVTKKPILYLGVGQEYGDLKKFDSNALLESLGL